MVHSPWEWWARVYSFPVVSPQTGSSLRRFEAPTIPDSEIPFENVSRWVEVLLARRQYRKAWALLTLLYLGRQTLPEPEMFQWQGFPHSSSLWIFDSRRSVLLPVPSGEITRAFSLWFALSGGLFARSLMRPDFSGFYQSWFSLSGPYFQAPLGDLTPEAALDRVKHVFEDLRGLQHATIDVLRQAPPKTTTEAGIGYLDGHPFMRTSVAAFPRDVNPWGEEWLRSLDGLDLPSDLLIEACRLRDIEPRRISPEPLPRSPETPRSDADAPPATPEPPPPPLSRRGEESRTS